MNGLALKLTALAAMALDHTAVALCTENGIVYAIFRTLGGLAFPIYCFLLTEGFSHTRNPGAYLRRLAVFALLSEIPFDLAVFGTWVYTGYQNVFFTLALGVLTLLGLRRFSGRPFFQALAAGCGCLAAALIQSDYGWSGILLICVLYLTRCDRPRQILYGCAASFLARLTAPFAFIPIHMYNGERGRQMKMLFYWFYPAHLLVLGILRMNL